MKWTNLDIPKSFERGR